MALINLSPTRLNEEALVVWHELSDEVDVVMEPNKLTFRPGSIDGIVANHVVDQLFFPEAKKAMDNWYECLKPGGKLFVLADDFEYVARGFVGGDITLETFNENHSHASQWDRKLLGDTLIKTGFKEENVKIWFEGIKDFIDRKHFELLIEASK